MEEAYLELKTRNKLEVFSGVNNNNRLKVGYSEPQVLQLEEDYLGVQQLLLLLIQVFL